MVLIEQQIYNKFEITICQIFINQLKTIIMKKINYSVFNINIIVIYWH